MIGQRFGRWTVIAVIPSRGRAGEMYRVRCDCGTEAVHRRWNLERARSRSCVKCKTPSCAVCGMEGHFAATCHVQSRGATEPDEADRVAQQLVPHARIISLPDVRRAVAAYLRERLGEAAE